MALIHYFDYASTAPLRPKALRAMLPYLNKHFGNPSNLYSLGREARQAVIRGTSAIAQAIKCSPAELVYTASATESLNLALAGAARANKESGNKIVISAVEHKGLVAICEHLKKEGFEIAIIPVLETGIIDMIEFKKQIDEKTILVSITMADSETGTIQPIEEIGRIIREVGNLKRKKNANLMGNNQTPNTNNQKITNHQTPITSYQLPTTNNQLPIFHSDASQAFSSLPIDVNKLGVDLMTISSHKLGGPKGIGGLYIRKGLKVEPIMWSGHHNKVSGGTENVPAIVGFAEAVKENENDKRRESLRVKKLRDQLEAGIFGRISKVILNGDKTKRLPNYLNVSILDIEGEALLLMLDRLGIIVGTGSACNSESLEPSAVLHALHRPYEFIHGSLRFTLGTGTKLADIKYVLAKLPRIVENLRKISPLNMNLDQKGLAEARAFIGKNKPHFL